MCPSQIDPTLPVTGNPTTASVRANFATAANEITALQAQATGAPFLPLSGGRMQAPMYLYNDPTDAMMPATKGYVDAGGGSGGGGIPEAPADGNVYGRTDGAWHQVLSINGGTLAGDLILHGDATQPLGAVTLEQLEALQSSILPDAPNDANTYGRHANAWTPILPISGGNVTGSLAVNITIPTSPAPFQATLFANTTTTLELELNSYQTASGHNRIAAGPAAMIGFDYVQGYVQLYNVGVGSAGSAITFSNPTLTIGPQGNIWLRGGSTIPTDSSVPHLSSAYMVSSTFAWNCYVGAAGPAWKVLTTGYSGYIYLDAPSGSVRIGVSASASAGGNQPAPQTFTFDQAGALTIPGGVYAGNGVRFSPTNNWEWAMYVDGSGNQIQNHRANWYDMWNGTSGARTWNSPAGQMMSLDGSGNLTINGTLSTPANVSATGSLTAVGGNMVIGRSSPTNNIMQFQGNYYWSFDTNSGNTIYYMGASQIWFMRNDSLVYNNWGAVAGHGPYSDISDSRSKEDVTPAPHGLAEILALEPIRFTRIPHRVEPDPNMPHIKTVTHPPEVGFIAEHVREHIPEAVRVVGMELPDGSGGIDSDQPSLAIASSGIVAVMVNAFKEVDARLRALEGTA